MPAEKSHHAKKPPPESGGDNASLASLSNPFLDIFAETTVQD